ncbi:MAG: inositol monophosphatase family protein [Ornithinimicrobium sp.]
MSGEASGQAQAGQAQAVPAEGLPDEAMRRQLRELAVELAIEAGRFVRDERPVHVDVRKTKASKLDVVTVMDTRCEEMLRASIAAERPGDAVLGEEEGLSEGSTGLTWVLDPIDGTVNYLYDIPAYAVSVAVVVGDPTVPGAWVPVAGAVFNPGVDEIFDAHLGGGARLGAAGESSFPRPRMLHTPEPESLARALIGTGFSYDTERRGVQGQVVTALLPQIRDLRRMGAASLDLCAVAAGRLNGYYERGLQPWDMAAGLLIAEEAGAVVSGVDGPPSADMVVAGAPKVHAELLAALLQALADAEG